MSTNLLAVLILGLAAAVVIAIFLVLWRERTSARQARLAIVSGVVLGYVGHRHDDARPARILPAA